MDSQVDINRSLSRIGVSKSPGGNFKVTTPIQPTNKPDLRWNAALAMKTAKASPIVQRYFPTNNIAIRAAGLKV